MGKIKILYVIKGIGVNGITKVAFSYYDLLDKNKYSVDFVSGEDYLEDYKNKVENNGNHFWIIKGRDKNIIEYIKKLKKIIRMENYDIVHVHGNSTMIFPELLAAKLGGTRIRIAHSHTTYGNHPKLVPIVRPLFDRLYTEGLACSKEAGRWMFKEKKFEIINNGINTDDYKFSLELREKYRTQLDIKSNEVLIGNVAAMTPVKNQKYLLDLLKELLIDGKQVKLLLVGEGELFYENKEYARKMEVLDNVIFYGKTNYVNEIMNAMDIFMFPSFYEGLGIVLIEAQASGMLCVANDKIPKESNLNGKICFLPLEEENNWKEQVSSCKMYDRSDESNKNINCIKENGYELKDCVKKLEEFYDTIYKKVE